jgi:hypothetical protein
VNPIQNQWRSPLDSHTFYEFENAGAIDVWTELFEFTRTDDGKYEFCVLRPPVDEDEGPYIEWESDEAVPASAILQQLFEGISDRGLRPEFALEAGLGLLPFLPADHAHLLRKSMANSIQSDDNLRKGIAALPREAQAALKAAIK